MMFHPARLLPLLLLPFLHAEPLTMPAQAWCGDSAFKEKDGKVTIELPDGWSFRDQDGRRNLFAGRDMYGGITFSHHVDGFASMGLGQRKKVEINGTTLHLTDSGKGYGYTRVLNDHWRLLANLAPYPAFEGKDSGTYRQQMLEIVAGATFTLPGHGDCTEGFLTTTLKTEGGKPLSFRFGKPSDEWSLSDGCLNGPDGLKLKLSVETGDVAEAVLGFYEKLTGAKGEAWNRQLGNAIIAGESAAGKTVILARCLEDGDAVHYLRLDAVTALTESSKEALLALLLATVTEG